MASSLKSYSQYAKLQRPPPVGKIVFKNLLLSKTKTSAKSCKNFAQTQPAGPPPIIATDLDIDSCAI